MPLRNIRGPFESPVPMALKIRKNIWSNYPTARDIELQNLPNYKRTYSRFSLRFLKIGKKSQYYKSH